MSAMANGDLSFSTNLNQVSRDDTALLSKGLELLDEVAGVVLGNTDGRLSSCTKSRVDLGSSGEDVLNYGLILLEHGCDAL
jgi:hypothetical protein